MIEKATYRNHLGEEIRFGENGIYLNAGSLRDYSWTPVKKNNRISAFDKDVVQKPLPVVIFAASEADGIAARNRLFEVVEKDVLAMKAGTLEVAGYRLECFVTGSAKSEYLLSQRYMMVNLTIQTDKPNWYKETTHSFFAETTAEDYEFLDYDFDYDIDYMSANNPRVLRNSNFTDTNFKLTIYGACDNPIVYIGGHAYQVNCSVQHGERIVIDSRQKTIVLIDKNRNETNIFNKRNRGSYIFKKIPAGNVSMTFDGSFDFDVILFEERSEPKWI